MHDKQTRKHRIAQSTLLNLREKIGEHEKKRTDAYSYSQCGVLKLKYKIDL